MNPDTGFGKQLEQFLLKVADKFINLTDQETQYKLIKLIHQIDTSASVADSPENAISTRSDTGSPAEPTTSAAESFAKQLEEQWQVALRAPFAQKPSDQSTITLQRLMTIQQSQIAATADYINRLNDLLTRIETSQTNTYRNTRLTSHYQALKSKYEVYLTTLQILHRKELSKTQ